MANTVRVMFVGQGGSLLPEDRFVNVFHFHSVANVDPVATAITNCLDNVQAFYNGTLSGGNTLGTHISAYVSRTAQLLAYNLNETPPRTPTVREFSLAAAVGGGLPEEVACCLSYEAASQVGPRRRGRIYIGPLSAGSSTAAPSTSAIPARPAQASAGNLVQTMAACASALAAAANLDGMPWVIRSVTPSVNYVDIERGYIDNAWDTQRRRGPETTARTLWE